MAECNVAGADPVGSARIGSAVLDGFGPFGALL